MKLLLFIAGVITAMAGCKDTSIKPSNIIGTWELRHYSGTIAGVSKDIPSNKGIYLQFNADSTFKHFTDFKQDNQGLFHVLKNGVTYGEHIYDGISFNDNQGLDYVVIKGDSLIIGNTFPDGVTSLYIRKDKYGNL
ncbi:hypothetical protein [Mucilaginibacter sp. L3T2-6]|uniref:hypothetical protein n=1 Tax=Mucilaginibacter sp. L3T2-6 TaxID=3062491 RepID=UPI002676D7F3|nr:hypothetical protein [Mucilaginibacter sp. L3T2-6]MDO3641615.1 hypothetical protein [Mucilaginibacter sp. L3T2-6]MDV6214109.1 hypothetical protein [Mucilaginibacter sp. L3T2-6]